MKAYPECAHSAHIIEGSNVEIEHRSELRQHGDLWCAGGGRRVTVNGKSAVLTAGRANSGYSMELRTWIWNKKIYAAAKRDCEADRMLWSGIANELCVNGCAEGERS